MIVATSVAQKASLKAIPGPAYMRGNRSIMLSDEYVSSEAIAKRTFKVRYWDKIKEDPYEAMMQYLLFVKGRELYLESVTRK